MDSDFKKLLIDGSESDVETLEIAQDTYGDSWKKRGGVGAFMMAARKWDRIENQCSKRSYDIFRTMQEIPCTNGNDGLLDDISDLICYLKLIRAEHLKETSNGS